MCLVRQVAGDVELRIELPEFLDDYSVQFPLRAVPDKQQHPRLTKLVVSGKSALFSGIRGSRAASTPGIFPRQIFSI